MGQLTKIQFTAIEKKSILETESQNSLNHKFYSYKMETHQNWAHNPFGILTHNLRNQVLGLNISVPHRAGCV